MAEFEYKYIYLKYLIDLTITLLPLAEERWYLVSYLIKASVSTKAAFFMESYIDRYTIQVDSIQDLNLL